MPPIEENDLFVLYRDDNSLRKVTLEQLKESINPITIGDTEPGNPGIGDLWVDTNECPPVLNIYDDCDDPGNPTWKPIGGGGDDGPDAEVLQPSIVAPSDNAGMSKKAETDEITKFECSVLTFSGNKDLDLLSAGDAVEQDSGYTPVTDTITSVDENTYSL